MYWLEPRDQVVWLVWFRRCFPYATLWVQRGREMDRFDPKITDVPTAAPTARQVVVDEAGLLRGGLKRRLVTRIARP